MLLELIATSLALVVELRRGKYSTIQGSLGVNSSITRSIALTKAVALDAAASVRRFIDLKIEAQAVFIIGIINSLKVQLREIVANAMNVPATVRISAVQILTTEIQITALIARNINKVMIASMSVSTMMLTYLSIGGANAEVFAGIVVFIASTTVAVYTAIAKHAAR